MLYLNSRVHFDEIVLTRLVNEEFNSTCTSVINGLCNLYGVIADSCPLLIGKTESRCKFNNLLVSSLNGAVSFI